MCFVGENQTALVLAAVKVGRYSLLLLGCGFLSWPHLIVEHSSVGKSEGLINLVSLVQVQLFQSQIMDGRFAKVFVTVVLRRMVTVTSLHTSTISGGAEKLVTSKRYLARFELVGY